MGTAVLAKIPPSRLVLALVKRSLPEPWLSAELEQLASGFLVEFPDAVRHAELVPVGAVGTVTEPAEPSTVRSWNGWLNSTVPAAWASGAATVNGTTMALASSSTAVTRARARRAAARKARPRLLRSQPGARRPPLPPEVTPGI